MMRALFSGGCMRSCAKDEYEVNRITTTTELENAETFSVVPSSSRASSRVKTKERKHSYGAVIPSSGYQQEADSYYLPAHKQRPPTELNTHFAVFTQVLLNEQGKIGVSASSSPPMKGSTSAAEASNKEVNANKSIEKSVHTSASGVASGSRATQPAAPQQHSCSIEQSWDTRALSSMSSLPYIITLIELQTEKLSVSDQEQLLQGRQDGSVLGNHPLVATSIHSSTPPTVLTSQGNGSARHMSPAFSTTSTVLTTTGYSSAPQRDQRVIQSSDQHPIIIPRLRLHVGQVLYQNKQSLAYWGNLAGLSQGSEPEIVPQLEGHSSSRGPWAKVSACGSTVIGSAAGCLLSSLFCQEPDELMHMMLRIQEVLHDEVNTRKVDVPGSEEPSAAAHNESAILCWKKAIQVVPTTSLSTMCRSSDVPLHERVAVPMASAMKTTEDLASAQSGEEEVLKGQIRCNQVNSSALISQLSVPNMLTQFLSYQQAAICPPMDGGFNVSGHYGQGFISRPVDTSGHGQGYIPRQVDTSGHYGQGYIPRPVDVSGPGQGCISGPVDSVPTQYHPVQDVATQEAALNSLRPDSSLLFKGSNKVIKPSVSGDSQDFECFNRCSSKNLQHIVSLSPRALQSRTVDFQVPPSPSVLRRRASAIACYEGMAASPTPHILSILNAVEQGSRRSSCATDESFETGMLEPPGRSVSVSRLTRLGTPNLTSFSGSSQQGLLKAGGTQLPQQGLLKAGGTQLPQSHMSAGQVLSKSLASGMLGRAGGGNEDGLCTQTEGPAPVEKMSISKLLANGRHVYPKDSEVVDEGIRRVCSPDMCGQGKIACTVDLTDAQVVGIKMTEDGFQDAISRASSSASHIATRSALKGLQAAEDTSKSKARNAEATKISFTAGSNVEAANQADDKCWHEVQASVMRDPISDTHALLLVQSDITERAEMEIKINNLLQTQLNMLEGMFPRHVLEYMMVAAASQGDEAGRSVSQPSFASPTGISRGAADGPYGELNGASKSAPAGKGLHLGGSFNPGFASRLGELAYQHEQVTILFMDIVGFTSMSKEVSPGLVMDFLNNLFSRFDSMCDMHNVYKVETAGDCYIVAGALTKVDDEGFLVLDGDGDARQGAQNVLDFAFAMMRSAQSVLTPHNGLPTNIRIGMHTGSVVSGVIGHKLPKFSLFGDTMNTSSRMESTSKPGCIQISETTYQMLRPEAQGLFEATGGVEVKGKGLMSTYLCSQPPRQNNDMECARQQESVACPALAGFEGQASPRCPAACVDPQSVASSPAAQSDSGSKLNADEQPAERHQQRTTLAGPRVRRSCDLHSGRNNNGLMQPLLAVLLNHQSNTASAMVTSCSGLIFHQSHNSGTSDQKPVASQYGTAQTVLPS